MNILNQELKSQVQRPPKGSFSIKKFIRKIIKMFGYEIEIRRLGTIDMSLGFQLYQYRKKDGTFDYEAYRVSQINGNLQKINNVWVMEENVAFLADYIKKVIGKVEFGICHGTRRGKEQEWFNKYLFCEVIGTEISDTATLFPNTIHWDYHEIKPEWINSVDFIYSNSFDHSYDPEKCLNSWMRCIKKNGVCIIEHTPDHERASQIDPFGANIYIMPYLILEWGKGNYFVKEIIDAPAKWESANYIKYLIIQNR